MVILHDEHRHDELIAKIWVAIFYVSECGERAEDIPTIFFSAKVRFYTPKRKQDPPFNLVFLFDVIKNLGPFPCLKLCIRYAAIGYDSIYVVSNRFAIFRLPLRGRNYALVGGHLFDGEIESRAAYPFGLGIRPQVGHESFKRLLLRLQRPAQKKRNYRNCKKSDHHGISGWVDAYRTLRQRYQPRTVTFQS